MIKQEKGKWHLYSKDGSRHLGGPYDSKDEAEERERQVEHFKHKSLVEVGLIITKANVQPDGSMRWQAITSDTDPDQTGEATTLQLFQDWINRIEKGATVDWLPPPRMPFLGISHYPSMDGDGEAGITQEMWIQGNRFKAGGVFNQSDLGKALFGAVRGDIDLTAKGNLIEKPIRISAAWWDIQHSHGPFVFTRKSLTEICPMCEAGEGNKKYLMGQLDHWASTRVPINPRTDLVLTERSMPKTTRKQDAESIVGEELAEELESKSQSPVAKAQFALEADSEGNPLMVVKAKGKKPADDDEMDEADESIEEGTGDEGEGEDKKKKPGKKAGGSYLAARAFDGAVTLSEAYEHPTQKAFTRLETFALVKRNIVEELPEGDRLGALSALVDELTDEVNELKTAVEDVYLLQPLDVDGESVEEYEDTPMSDYLEQFIEAVATARESEGTPEEKAALYQKALNGVATAMKAELEGPADSVSAFKAALAPLADQLAQINARLSGGANLGPQVVPVQKSTTNPTINDPAQQQQNQLPVSPITNQQSGLTQIVRRSVGLY